MTGTKMLNPMYSIATDQTIAYAEQIKDESRNKFQKDINDEVQQELGTKLGPQDYQTLYDLACAGLVL